MALSGFRGFQRPFNRCFRAISRNWWSIQGNMKPIPLDSCKGAITAHATDRFMYTSSSSLLTTPQQENPLVGILWMATFCLKGLVSG